jgi:murein hydrolase activator
VKPLPPALRAAHLEVMWPLAALIPLPLPFSGAATWAAVVLYECVLAWAYLRARRGLPVTASNLALNVAALCYLVWFWIELRYLRHGLVRTASHLLLFTAVAKLLSLKTGREARTALLLLFLLALDSAATSVHVSVLAFFLALAWVAYRTLARLAVLADFDDGPPAAVYRRLPTAGIATVSIAAVAALAVPFFVLVPRLQTPFAQAPIPRDIDNPSFFTSDRVDLGAFAAAKRSDRIVLTVTPIRGPIPVELRLRETTFNRYSDGRWWREGMRGSAARADADGRVEVAPGHSARAIEIQESSLSPGFLFLPYGTTAVTVRKGALARSPDGTLAAMARGGVGLFQAEYTPGPRGAPGRVSVATHDIPPEISLLAHRIAAGAGSRQEAARRLFAYLQQGFRYSLDTPPPVGEPIVDFLTRTHAGHCEHFASALALMLRAEGIPARLVTGSLGGDEGFLGSTITVRGSHLHAWVEADLDGGDFRVIDPTPAAGRPGLGRAGFWRRFLQLGNQMEFFFDRNILGFDAFDQTRLLEAMRDGADRTAEIARRLRSPEVARAAGIAVLGIGLAAAIALLARSRRRRPPPATRAYLALRRLHARRIGELPESAPAGTVVKGFAARGRAAGASARRIVEVYRREAFGGLPTAPEQERELRRELTKLARHAAWILLLAALLGGRALAQTGASEVSSDATVRRHEDLRVLQRRLEESRRRLAAAEKARAGLKQEIDTLDLRLEVAARERDVIAARRAELVKTTEALSSEAEQARTARERAARMLRARILLLSRLGRFGYLRLMLSVEDPRDVVSAMKTLHAVARADAGTLARFSEAGRRLGAALANEMAARRDAEKLLAEDREQEQRIEMLKAERVNRLRKTEAEASQTRRQVAGLSEKAQKLEELLDRLSRGESSAAGTPRPWKGVLDWPVQGKIAVTFGRHRHPKFDAWTVSNGIEISTPEGSPVAAIYAGSVVFARWFPEYGNMVVVDHGDQVLSLYARLRSATVKVGDSVAAADRVGLVGIGPGETEPSLYFEVRDHQKASDPLTWLR